MKLVQAERKMTWCEAYAKLMDGGVVAREGWNGKGLFVIKMPSSQYCIPLAIKNHIDDPEFRKSNDLTDADVALCIVANDDPDDSYTIETHFLIKNTKGTFDTWVPSISDILAKDWCILKPE